MVPGEKRTEIFDLTTTVEGARLKGLSPKIGTTPPGLDMFMATDVPSRRKIETDKDFQSFIRDAVANRQSNNVTVSWEPQKKSYSKWTLPEVQAVFGLSFDYDPIPDWNPRGPQTDFEWKVEDALIEELDRRTRTLGLTQQKGAVRSELISCFVSAATDWYGDEFTYNVELNVDGIWGWGVVDYTIHPDPFTDDVGCVIEMKLKNVDQGRAQNIVQMDSAARNRSPSGCTVDCKSFGVVSTAFAWQFLEGTLSPSMAMSFTMIEGIYINFLGKKEVWEGPARQNCRNLVHHVDRARYEYWKRRRYMSGGKF